MGRKKSKTKPATDQATIDVVRCTLLASYGPAALGHCGAAVPEEWISALFKLREAQHTNITPICLGSPFAVFTPEWWKSTITPQQVIEWSRFLPAFSSVPAYKPNTSILSAFAEAPSPWFRVALVLASAPLCHAFDSAVPIRNGAALWSTHAVNTLYDRDTLNAVYTRLWNGDAPTFVSTEERQLCWSGSVARCPASEAEGWRAWAAENSVFVTKESPVSSVDVDSVLSRLSAFHFDTPDARLCDNCPPEALCGLDFRCLSFEGRVSPQLIPIWMCAQIWLRCREAELEQLEILNLDTLPAAQFGQSTTPLGYVSLDNTIIGDTPSETVAGPGTTPLAVIGKTWTYPRRPSSTKHTVHALRQSSTHFMWNMQRLPYIVFRAGGAWYVTSPAPSTTFADVPVRAVCDVPVPGESAKSLWTLPDNEDAMRSVRCQLHLWSLCVSEAVFGWVSVPPEAWFGIVGSDPSIFAPMPLFGVQIVRLGDRGGASPRIPSLVWGGDPSVHTQKFRLRMNEAAFVQSVIVARGKSACWNSTRSMETTGDWRVANADACDSRFGSAEHYREIDFWSEIHALNSTPAHSGKPLAVVRYE